jgi:hypothetical protein
MKSNIQHITAADLRVTYYGENGRIKLIKTARSHAAWWLRQRLPYHVEGVGLYLRHVGRNLRQIEWRNS